MRKNSRKGWSMVLCLSLVLGALVSGPMRSSAEGVQTGASDLNQGTSTAVSGSAVEPSATPVTDPTPMPTPVDVTKIAISKSKAILMVGKTVKPVITGTESPITWKSADETIATVDEMGKITAKKKGKTVITASMDGISQTCEVTVVAKMAKKDFSKFNSENFVHYCQRHGYNRGYAWNGQWKGGSKKKTTARGIKIGATKSKIHSAYGELTWKKCSSKDPFTKMKGLKKNKVKTYGDVTYGKYRIRFYLNSKKKVVAIIFACNINKIKKKHLKKYI